RRRRSRHTSRRGACGGPSEKRPLRRPSGRRVTRPAPAARVLERGPVRPVLETPVRAGSVQKGGATLLPRLPSSVLVLALLLAAADGRASEAPCAVAADCDDSDACTGDACVAGACEHRAVSDCAACTTDADCDDGNRCTADRCAAGRCATEPIAGC